MNNIWLRQVETENEYLDLPKLRSRNFAPIPAKVKEKAGCKPCPMKIKREAENSQIEVRALYGFVVAQSLLESK
jgi:hypothetical protein